MLNVCFERPLAIIRSEKTSTPSTSGKLSSSTSHSPNEMMSIHGITADSGKQREISLRQDIDTKQKKLSVLQQEATRTKEALQARLAIVATATEVHESLEDVKRRHKSPKPRWIRHRKNLQSVGNDTQQNRAHPEAVESLSSSKKMTTGCLRAAESRPHACSNPCEIQPGVSNGAQRYREGLSVAVEIKGPALATST
jgi:ribosomal protein S13